MKKVIAMALCAVLLLCLFSACSGKESNTPTPPAETSPEILEGKTTVVGAEKQEDAKYQESITIICDNTQMAVLDPASPQGGGQGSLMNFNCIHDTLVENDNGTLIPCLALKWDVEDSQHYTLYLRDDIYFHNGEKFTADDVAFTIEHAKAAKGGQAFNRLSVVDTVEVIDDTTIKITLNRPNNDFLYYLYSPVCSILNREACEKDPEKGPWIGTGAWIVEKFVSNEYSELKVNENYWGEIPVTKKLRFIKVAEEATRYMMLMNGEADVAFGCSPADFDSIRSNPEFNLYTYVICNAGFVGFNMTDPLMQDINFRKAVACLLNRSDIIKGTRYGYGAAPTSGAFWGYTTPYKNEDLPLQDYDVELAKEYLEKSKYNGETVELCAWIPEFKTICQILQAELMNLGVKAEVFETDQAGFMAHCKFDDNKSQIVCTSGGWTGYPSSTAPFFTKGSTSNVASYVNPEITELLNTAVSTKDEAERERCYKEVQRLAYEDCVYVPVMHIQHGVGAAKNVGGVILTEENTHDLSHVFKNIS